MERFMLLRCGSAGCWHPAIFPLSNLAAAGVLAGDSLRVRAATADNCMQLELAPSLDRESTEDSMMDSLCCDADSWGRGEGHSCGCAYVPATDLLGPTVLSPSRFNLKSTEIYRLNNNQLDKTMFSAMFRFMSAKKSFTMLDMTPMFSTLPVQACAVGAAAAYWLTADDYYSSMYKMLCYRVGVNNATPVPDMEAVQDRDIDCVLCDLVEPSGVLRQHVLNDLAFLKLTSLRRCGGCVIPAHLRICAQAIRSPQLLESNQVLGDNRTCQLKISSHFNQFRARTQRDIDMSTLTYTTCGEVMELMTLNFNSTQVDAEGLCCLKLRLAEVDIFNVKTLKCSDWSESSVCFTGLPEFLNQERVLDRDELSRCLNSLTVDAIVYWFELLMDDTETLSTLSGHWRQAALVLSSASCSESHDTSCDKLEITKLVVKVENGALSLSASTHIDPH